MLSKLKRTILAIALIAILIPTVILAGSTGKIKGVITDRDTGSSISGVSVSLDGTTLSVITDNDGRFLMTWIKPGNYTLRIASIGYCTIEVDSLIVAADMTTEQNIEMIRISDNRDINKVIRITAAKKDFNNHINESREYLRKREDKLMPIPDSYEMSGSANEAGIIGESESTFQVDRNERQKRLRRTPSGGQANNWSNCLPPPGIPPAHGGTAIVNGEPYDAMFFKNYGINPFVDTEDDHLSTFAIDTDDASYIMARSYLERGALPPSDAIRVEEFINHFDYNYKSPRREPFQVYLEGGPSKFGQNCQLLKIGIKGKKIDSESRKPANLVFVIDVSGSMEREDRLDLVKQALSMLVEELEETDKVGIVVYGSHGEVVLEPASIWQRGRILDAIRNLHPSGSTNAEEGLRLGYRMADRCFEAEKINRIILCSDGVANVGMTGADDLLGRIQKYANKGITLSAIGFGMGNYNDILMENLGNKGNGYYAYVDDISEAHRIFVENLTGALQVIARDVKIQVDFDPDVVRSYRLLGYENRDVDDDKFRDNKEDGGEIGAGHEVTALYEIKLHREVESGKIGDVFIRYKDPESFEIDEIRVPIRQDILRNDFRDCSEQFKLAAVAAEFSEIMRKSYWAKGSDLQDLIEILNKTYYGPNNDKVSELKMLISRAMAFRDDLAEK
jgi:Ca-activated chloride channel family protein